jgi:hypothetical protein
MLPPLVTVSDLEQRLGVAVGSLAGLDLARAEAAISDASALARLYGRDWVDADGTTIAAPDAVLVVVVSAAKRAYDNPTNYQGESLGDGSYSWQAGQGDALIYLSDAEVRLIRTADAKAGGAGGLVTTRTPSAYYDAARDPWVVSNPWLGWGWGSIE